MRLRLIGAASAASQIVQTIYLPLRASAESVSEEVCERETRIGMKRSGSEVTSVCLPYQEDDRSWNLS